MFRCSRITTGRAYKAPNSNSLSSSYKPGEYFRRFQLQIMTESQPEGSETTRGAMEEDLIEESAFEVEETDQYTQRTSAKSNRSSNENHRQAKVKATRRRRSFLGQRRKWKLC